MKSRSRDCLAAKDLLLTVLNALTNESAFTGLATFADSEISYFCLRA